MPCSSRLAIKTSQQIVPAKTDIDALNIKKENHVETNPVNFERLPDLNRTVRVGRGATDSRTNFMPGLFLNFDNISIQPGLPSGIQTKLTVNTLGDKYEREADAMADRIIRMPGGSSIQRKCSECEEEEAKLQRKSLPGGGPAVGVKTENDPVAESSLTTRIAGSKGSGNSLDKSTQSFMSGKFGFDFSNVKIHSDNKAAQMSREVNARAFTMGKDIYFNNGEYDPGSERGKYLLAHELTHVIQQSNSRGTVPTLQRYEETVQDAGPSVGDTSSPSYIDDSTESESGSLSPLEILACTTLLPPIFWPLCFAEDKEVRSKAKSPLVQKRCKDYKGGGGRSGGGGASGDWDEPDTTSKKLNFYHGTRWSIAKGIPGNVKPLGGGDFATGFYTHQDKDDQKALQRAVKWGIVIANKKPKEPYAGVIRFAVPENDYRQLFAGGKGKVFDLTTTNQKDFKVKQKEWLDFITSNGRYSKPDFVERRKQWVHQRRDPQPKLPYNIIQGPFYTPLKGSKGRMPGPEEFTPYAEGTQLPQQVSWANDGITLLNSSKVATELKQYDARTGKVKSPPDESAATTSVPDAKQMIEATEEAQFSM